MKEGKSVVPAAPALRPSAEWSPLLAQRREKWGTQVIGAVTNLVCGPNASEVQKNFHPKGKTEIRFRHLGQTTKYEVKVSEL